MYKDKIISDLKKMIDTNIPIIYINDYDAVRVYQIIDEAIPGGNIIEWAPGIGISDFASLRREDNGLDKKNNAVDELKDFLNEFAEISCTKKPRYILLREVHELIKDASIKSILASIALRKLYDTDFELTVIILSSLMEVPEELNPFISFLDIGFPDDEMIDQLINEHIRINGYVPRKDFREKELPDIRLALKGMSPFAIDRMLDIAMSQNGTLNSDDTAVIMAQKKLLVRKSGVLEFVETRNKLEDIGGLTHLKDYLKKKKDIITNLSQAMRCGISVPKGIFLVGMPGCGKSLTAQAAATCFGKPLLKLDMGKLMGKYVGESEYNLRKAIATAEAVAPCVLWIDEIEKGFSGIGGDSDVVTRMFGYFLSWMQDKESAVYVIATANNVDKLPAELKRKGRFDELFFVGLPDDSERRTIFEIHLKKKSQNKNIIDNNIIKETEGCNGADIEHIVNTALENRFHKLKNKDIEKIELGSKDLLYVAEKTISIKKSCKNDLRRMLETMLGSSFINANSGELVNDECINNLIGEL